MLTEQQIKVIAAEVNKKVDLSLLFEMAKPLVVEDEIPVEALQKDKYIR